MDGKTRILIFSLVLHLPNDFVKNLVISAWAGTAQENQVSNKVPKTAAHQVLSDVSTHRTDLGV